MSEKKKKKIITAVAVVLALSIAYCFRIIGKGRFYPTFFSYLRSFIYIGLYTAWGLSIRKRIVQKQVRKYLTMISVLLIFWMVERSAKYFIFWQPDVIRYLWYLFYLPMLFVPMLAVLIAMSLGQPDEYKLPKTTLLLWMISGAMLLLVLTNDLHQIVFTFPKSAAVWTDQDNGYSIGHFGVAGWQVILAVTALIIMFNNCRIPNGKRRFLPVIPLLLSLIYSALYYAGVNWLRFLFGDIAAFQGVMYLLTFEFCISCNLIRSNSRYVDLFTASKGTSAEITDRSFNVKYAAGNAMPISREIIEKAVQSPVETADGLTVHAMPIGGGYAIWTEDVSALLEAREELESLAEELSERNEILLYEYKREAKRRKMDEQNRLYDLLQSTTQTQMDRIAVLAREYRKLSKADTAKARLFLSEIAILCSYIKRRKHLTLLADHDYRVPITELERAFTESLQTLKLLQVRSTLYVEPGLSMVPGKTAAAMFDFYESVLETDLDHLAGMQVSLANMGGLRLSLNICCKADLSCLADKENIRYEADEDDDYQRIVFFVGEGVQQ